MKTIGIRELRQRASELLRQVERGESFEVTDRGRPVARLVPRPAAKPLDALRAAGEVSSPKRDLADLAEPLSIAKGAEPPSVLLARLRADER